MLDFQKIVHPQNNANCNQKWNKSHTKSIRLSRTQYQDRNWWRRKPNCTVSTWQKFSNWCSLVLYKDICKITSLDDYNRITIGDDVYTVFLHTWKWNLKKGKYSIEHCKYANRKLAKFTNFIHCNIYYNIIYYIHN